MGSAYDYQAVPSGVSQVRNLPNSIGLFNTDGSGWEGSLAMGAAQSCPLWATVLSVTGQESDGPSIPRREGCSWDLFLWLSVGNHEVVSAGSFDIFLSPQRSLPFRTPLFCGTIVRASAQVLPPLETQKGLTHSAWQYTAHAPSET